MTTPLDERVDAVAEHLLQFATWTASRSSGPGGQRRDKVATRAELTIPPSALEGLDDFTFVRLARNLGLGDADLRITSQEDRMLSRNREIAVERLKELLAAALAPPPPRRRATRPSRTKVAERVAGKRQRSVVKRLRQAPDGD
ncbi:MAG TPA: peptide chain release factor-like protein [Candidatus Dormibacteraeota bacterium]|nr:peptide chain release factor-like protein [Candidatus Dormibacteraeota bacterium]